MKNNNKIAVIVPAYKAQDTIQKLYASIYTQKEVEYKVFVVNDWPSDTEESYKPNVDIDWEFIDTEKNEGPGVARNKGLEAAISQGFPFVTFIDADDVLFDSYSLYKLQNAVMKTPNCIESMGIFLSPVPTPDGIQFIPRGGQNDVWHPWVFGRMYVTQFLKDNGLKLHHIRAMEDSYLQTTTRLLIEGTPLQVAVLNDPVYLWNEGSEHSITRTGTDINDGIPIYNYGLCQLGAAVAYRDALDFCNKKNPFSPSVIRMASELMIDKYFTYYETIDKCPKYKDQADWIARYFYHNCFEKYCKNVTTDTLNEIYKAQIGRLSQFNKLPAKTFEEWFDELQKTSKPEIDELKEIRNKLPEEIVKAEISTGVVTEDIGEFFND